VAGASAGTRQDIGHTLRTGRPELTTRAAALVPVEGGTDWPAPVRFRRVPEAPPALVFMLPGEDAGAAPTLYRTEPVFRSAVDDGLAVMARTLDPETFAAVRGAFVDGGTPASDPVLHLLGAGLHAFLDDLGIRPDLLMGQGVGELTAARLSGVLSAEDAARAVCWRGRAVADTPSEAAAHFARRLRDVRLHAPVTPVISGVTGSWLTGEEAGDPGYWGVQLGDQGAFDEGVRTVVAEYPDAVYLQLGGGTGLLDAARRGGVAADAVLTLLPDVLQAVGGLWERGVRIDWDAYAEHDHALRIDVAPRAFARTPWLHPALLEHCPGIDPAEPAGKQADR
jgi:acyl transferase domain-containing protein